MDVGKVYRGRVVGVNERTRFSIGNDAKEIRSIIAFQDTQNQILSVEVVGHYEIGDMFNILITVEPKNDL